MNLHFPVIFSLMVNGKRQGAHLETILDAGTFNVFSIGFADGYHDCFFSTGDGNIRGINEIKGKPYAAALKHDLHVFNHLKEGAAIENFPYEAEGQFANGWIFTKQGSTGLVYTIYLKGIYQFDIIEKEKGWTAVAEKAEGRGEIDQKLANYAFKWVTTPAASALVHEEQTAPQRTVDKPVEFLLDFEFKGSPMVAFGLLQDTRPWQQCTIGVKTGDAQSSPEFYEFYKVDNRGQLFSWIPYSGTKEKMAKAIAGALEQHFSTNKVFSIN